MASSSPAADEVSDKDCLSFKQLAKIQEAVETIKAVESISGYCPYTSEKPAWYIVVGKVISYIILVCYQFFKQLRNRYGRKPIFTDGASWYNTACRWLRLPHQMYSTELKNMMERFIQHIEDKTECFDDHFPCRKPIVTGSISGTG